MTTKNNKMLKKYLSIDIQCKEDSARVGTTDDKEVIVLKIGSAGLPIKISDLKEAIEECEKFYTTLNNNDSNVTAINSDGMTMEFVTE